MFKVNEYFGGTVKKFQLRVDVETAYLCLYR